MNHYNQLLKTLGFTVDPFAKTNADEEEKLEDYFIEPPFFRAVKGDITTPKSTVVFAPMGAGKTALKRKIELTSEHEPILCLTYNKFNTQGIQLSDIDQGYHMRNIVRLVLVGVLALLNNENVDKLTTDDRHYVYLFVNQYLSEIEKSEIKDAVASVTNITDKAKEWWNRLLGPVSFGINILLNAIGIKGSEIRGFSLSAGNLGSYRDQLSILKSIAQKLGRPSIYILIDKVDETELTGTSTTTYQFIKPILFDLQTLEMPGIAFKFFLRDFLRDYYFENGRPDRVKPYSLSWTTDQLMTMLSKRLQAFSEKRVSSFSSICNLPTEFRNYNIDRIIAMFAQGSPRNVIRICKDILDCQSEIDYSAKAISVDAITNGLEEFSKTYSLEVALRNINELQKLTRVAFSVSYIANDIYKVSTQAANSKVKVWREKDIIELLGTVPGGKKRPVNYYAIKHLLVAKHIFNKIPVFDFLDKKVRVCTCGEVLLRDWDVNHSQLCHRCQKIVDTYTTESVLR
ncbi:hypothetical protein [Kyrpidia sp.]|uniref:P-loop ATPase, Sll1717 family n=1 Tax=Kyrpidia sp. TaxID=2073077 RepID=UPI0025829E37|nr:hypothetical protein [Kyrpidia sp.]MCL6577534.1 hypothetical protein [Kyrpidia sp.]